MRHDHRTVTPMGPDSTREFTPTKDVCVLCPGQAGTTSALCPACGRLESEGWPIVHDQEIHAGDYFEGTFGFVWDGEATRPGFVRFYGLGSDPDSPSVIYEYHELRVRASKRTAHNPNGHVVREKWEPLRVTR